MRYWRVAGAARDPCRRRGRPEGGGFRTVVPPARTRLPQGYRHLAFARGCVVSRRTCPACSPVSGDELDHLRTRHQRHAAQALLAGWLAPGCLRRVVTRLASCYRLVTEVMGLALNRGIGPLTVPSRVMIRERGIVLTSTIMLCVILCWRSPESADALAAVPGLTRPGHRSGRWYLPARSRPAVPQPVIALPDAG